jgi:hypothetical protein
VAAGEDANGQEKTFSDGRGVLVLVVSLVPPSLSLDDLNLFTRISIAHLPARLRSFLLLLLLLRFVFSWLLLAKWRRAFSRIPCANAPL